MKLSDLDFYASPWLSVGDLAGRAARVTIADWKIEEVMQRDKSKAKKVALIFIGKKKRLLLNMTQGRAAEAAWGDQIEGWVGKQCILQPGRAENGKETILLVPLPPQADRHEEPPPAANMSQAEPATQQPPPAEDMNPFDV